MKDEAAMFKVLGDPIRLRLSILLAVHGEICVCRLADALDEPQFKISRHLGIMRAAGMVEARRDGTWMYYKLSAPKNRLQECLQECFRDCLLNHRTVAADTGRMEKASCET